MSLPTNRDGMISAMVIAQRPNLYRSAPRTSVANAPFSVFDLAGSPGPGVLAGTSTAAGVVPDANTVGAWPIAAFPTNPQVGVIGLFQASNTVASRIAIYDLMFKAGAYAFNANVNLSGQPSYSQRVAGDFTGCELWLECVTAFTGSQTIQVGYLDQDGNHGSTGAVATGVAPTVGRMLRLPLAAGDIGVQAVTSVASSVSSTGTFNVLVMRRLCEARIRSANDQQLQGPDHTGMARLKSDACLYMVVTPDGTSTGLPDVLLGLAAT